MELLLRLRELPTLRGTDGGREFLYFIFSSCTNGPVKNKKDTFEIIGSTENLSVKVEIGEKSALPNLQKI